MYAYLLWRTSCLLLFVSRVDYVQIQDMELLILRVNYHAKDRADSGHEIVDLSVCES